MKSGIAILVFSGVVHAAQGGSSSLGTSPVVARGEKLFAQGCAVGYCHGSAGAAARSPRLRGRTFETDYLSKVIRDGIPNSAMPAWGDRLTDDDINALVAYIHSLSTASAEGPAPSETASAAPVTIIESDVPAEARQGRQLFSDSGRAARCSDCHRVLGVGVSVGTDLMKLTPAQLAVPASAILTNGRARSVRTVITKDGDRFPAIIVERKPKETRLYDLKGTPPVHRNLLTAEIRGIQRHSNWRHAKAVQSYNVEELKSTWEFIRWAAQNRKK